MILMPILPHQFNIEVDICSIEINTVPKIEINRYLNMIK